MTERTHLSVVFNVTGKTVIQCLHIKEIYITHHLSHDRKYKTVLCHRLHDGMCKSSRVLHVTESTHLSVVSNVTVRIQSFNVFHIKEIHVAHYLYMKESTQWFFTISRMT